MGFGPFSSVLDKGFKVKVDGGKTQRTDGGPGNLAAETLEAHIGGTNVDE